MIRRRVRITNGTGNSIDTKVTDADTGESLRCSRAVITYDVNGDVRAKLYVVQPAIDVVADAEIVTRTLKA